MEYQGTNGEGILILKSISLKLIVICSHIQRVTVKNYIGELPTRVKIQLELYTTSALGSWVLGRIIQEVPLSGP